MANISEKTNSALCPICDAKVSLPKKVTLGQFAICHKCTESLKVINIRPIELDWADGIDEDDDYEFDDSDYDDDSSDEYEQGNKRSNYWS